MKKIIALAITSAFIAPAVMAEATIYGMAATSVQYESTKDSTLAANNVNRFRLADQDSKLGFKGSDKLDSGLTVFWQSEHRIRVGSSNFNGTNDSSAGWGDRTSIIGLQGDFGLIKAGKVDDVTDDAPGDFFKGTGNIEETGSGVNNFARRGASRAKNIIIYHSPKFSGFAFKADYDFGQKKVVGANTVNGQGFAASAFYQSTMFDAGVAYKQINDSNGSDAQAITADGDNFKALTVGASVHAMPGLDIGAAWNQLKAKSGNTDYKQDGFGVGMNYTTGKYLFAFGYGQLNNYKKNGATKDDSKVWGLSGGMAYSLSKQTQLISGFQYIKNGKNADGAQGAFGANMGSNGSSAGAGAKVTAVSVGIRTNF